MQKNYSKKTTKLHDITEGSVLADNVIDCSGRFLISKDTVVTASHIRILKIWGIKEIVVYQAEKPVEQYELQNLQDNPGYPQSLPLKLQLSNLDNPFMFELVQHTVLKK